MKKWLKIPLLQVPEIFWRNWSGRADLNGRPPAPKAGALTRLRYAPLLEIPITKYPAYRQAGKLQINSNESITKPPRYNRENVQVFGNWDLSNYSVLGAFYLNIDFLFNTSLLLRQPSTITKKTE